MEPLAAALVFTILLFTWLVLQSSSYADLWIVDDLARTAVDYGFAVDLRPVEELFGRIQGYEYVRGLELKKLVDEGKISEDVYYAALCVGGEGL